MSRTTLALKRLAVPGLAAATAIAGLPLFLGSASAAPGESVTLTPEAVTATSGTCTPFTISVKDVNGAAAANRVVDVILTERTPAGTAPTETFDVVFCRTVATNNGGNNTTALPAQTQPGGAVTNNSAVANDTDQAEFTTDSAGNVTFGVQGTEGTTPETGQVDIVAFLDDASTTGGIAANDDTLNGGEVNDTSTLTITAGGTNTGAATPTNDAAGNNSANNLAATLEAQPKNAFAVEDQPFGFITTSRDASGRTLVNVTPTGDVTAGPNNAQPVSCDASDNNGVSRCSYTPLSPGTDTIVVYVNRRSTATGAANSDALDDGEPRDTIQVTTQTTQPAGSTVSLVPNEGRTDNQGQNIPGTTTSQRPLTDTTQTFTATVRNNGGGVVSGVLVNISISGQTPAASNMGTSTAPDVESVTPTQALTDANGQVQVTLNNPVPTANEQITVLASISSAGAMVTDDSTVTYVAVVQQDARFISLDPATASTSLNNVVALTATVTDRFGNPVPGASVDFTENGTGAFRNGSSALNDVQTDANGRAVAEVTSTQGETAGSTTVTATIDSGSATFLGVPTGGRAAGAGNDECEQAANSNVRGNAFVTAAPGNCADSSVVTFTSGGGTSPAPSASATPTATTSPSATPTASASTSPSSSSSPSATTSPSGPPAPACTTPASITLDRSTIIATGSAQITVRGTANSIVDVFAYSRPSTTYRVVRSAELGADGTAVDRVTPPTNTRLYAQQRGCNASPSIVLNVRTQISLNVVRNGVRNYTFSGSLLPARPNGLIASLYRVTNDGRQILAAQTRANANVGQAGYDDTRPAGSYSITRQFTGSGRFGFVVRTGQDLQNAPGSSNIRSLAVF